MLPHHPSEEVVAAWPSFTKDAPMRVLVSGCLAGLPCGADGTSYGEYPLARFLLARPNVKAFAFCPEDRAYGTPRFVPNISRGNGFDVLQGRAQVQADTDAEEVITAPMLREAREMAALGAREQVHVALMMDISGACGSTVVYNGRRRDKRFATGPGVAGAAVMELGIPVVSQRDERTLRLLLQKLGAEADAPFGDGLDHHERDWYIQTFGAIRTSG